MKRITFLFILITISSSHLFGQRSFSFQENLQWSEEPISYSPYEGKTIEAFYFEEATYSHLHTLPIYTRNFSINEYGELSVELKNAVYEPIVKKDVNEDKYISEDIKFEAQVEIQRRKYMGFVSFIPIRKNLITGELEKLVSFTLEVQLSPKPIHTKTKRGGSISVLNDGDIYKIAVANSGVHKLDYNFLKDLGVDVDNIDPKQIKLYGNGGGPLPELNATARYDDLVENPIVVEGENDGKFNESDYILFYGEQSDDFFHNTNTNLFQERNHAYADSNHYFIKISSGEGKRIENQSSLSSPNYTTTTFNYYVKHEDDRLNLLDYYTYTLGSGREWYGESFRHVTERDIEFDIPNLVTSSPLYIRTALVSRSIGASSTYSLSANGQNVFTESIGSVPGGVDQEYAKEIRPIYNFTTTTGSPLLIKINYQKGTSTAEGWLNYIEINARRNLTFDGGQMDFRDLETLNHNNSKFLLTSNNSNVTIWDITNPIEVKSQQFNVNSNKLDFTVNTSELREFIVFDDSDFHIPTPKGAVENQNLHGMQSPNLLIIYHKKFENEALRLASHRSNFSNITVEVADVDQIYNEYSTGNADITAIRDFVKSLYDQGDELKNILLFGDASFDYKNIMNNPENHHYIPTYETSYSLHPQSSYPSDDYYGLMDDTEGNISTGQLDIGIGRIPARTETEARAAVDKIIRYDSDPQTLGDWKNRLTFVADDEDGNLHFNQSNSTADITSGQKPNINIEKIFLDAYTQTSTQGGNRYPEANNLLNASMFKGNFVMNYTGHGDEAGWAQERVLTEDDIKNWQNRYFLPLFITATCTFGPYDAPHKLSAGEQLFLKPDGGACALYTTTRVVQAVPNDKLTKSTYNYLFQKDANNKYRTLGEVLSVAKNNSGTSTPNTRKFVLIGDPSMKLSYPEHNVITTMVNNENITGNDTVRALQKVTISGYIANADSSIRSTFNGTIYPTVFDKALTITTRKNDDASKVANFKLQKNIIFRGKASVSAGRFTFSFIVPKDINYNYGNGKVSYYAEAGIGEEASGNYNGLIIGGTDPNAALDNEGPLVQVFMNNEQFVFGGITDENPVMYVKLYDDNGINTVGTGIGHDLTGFVDENTQQTYVLNDFYESATDDYRSGIVRYPLSELEEGRHSVTVKAWDVANNSGTGYTEFVVASSAKMALDHVLNYPNPFTTHTEFQFEHNFPNQSLAVQIQIFSMSGQIVKTIHQDIQSDGFRVTGIEWDGNDDFGNPIGKGVYVYKVSVGAMNEEGTIETSESKFEKLVVLK